MRGLIGILGAWRITHGRIFAGSGLVTVPLPETTDRRDRQRDPFNGPVRGLSEAGGSHMEVVNFLGIQQLRTGSALASGRLILCSSTSDKKTLAGGSEASKILGYLMRAVTRGGEE